MSYIQHKAEESLEDYLETILILSRRLSVVRSIDVATELNFSKPSVSVAVKNLKNREYIQKARDKGVKFVCATGRGYSSIQTTLEEIGSKDMEGEYTISYNGGVITENKDNRLIHFEGLDFDTAEKLFFNGLKYDVCIHVYTLETVWIYNIFDGEIDYLNGRQPLPRI